MESEAQILFEFSPFFRAYKDGRVERSFGTDFVSTGIDLVTGVISKDVQICSETGVSARLFMPTVVGLEEKLPLLVYFHGGAFLVGSPFCPTYHNFACHLANAAKIIVVSVNYRLAPENPVPIAYEDSWAALKWVATHVDGLGPEPVFNQRIDWARVFLGGDSAGGNIVHNITAQAGEENLNEKIRLVGAFLVHPYFANEKSDAGYYTWQFACPTSIGSKDPRINPKLDPRTARIGCDKVLICLAELDPLREGGIFYYETLVKSGWGGDVAIFETKGESHVFHLFNPNCDEALALTKRLSSFINQEENEISSVLTLM